MNINILARIDDDYNLFYTADYNMKNIHTKELISSIKNMIINQKYTPVGIDIKSDIIDYYFTLLERYELHPECVYNYDIVKKRIERQIELVRKLGVILILYRL